MSFSRQELEQLQLGVSVILGRSVSDEQRFQVLEARKMRTAEYQNVLCTLALPLVKQILEQRHHLVNHLKPEHIMILIRADEELLYRLIILLSQRLINYPAYWPILMDVIQDAVSEISEMKQVISLPVLEQED